MMITQAIKRWLHKMFAWWPWKSSPETEYIPVASSLNKGTAQDGRDSQGMYDAMPWSTTEEVAPPSSIAPLIFGQGEISRSTFGEWPERVVQSSPLSNEKAEPPLPLLPTSLPVEQAIDNGVSGTSGTSTAAETVFLDILPTPTPGQQLEFLSYLVRRGLVNEGFPEGQVPDQYRKK